MCAQVVDDVKSAVQIEDCKHQVAGLDLQGRAFVHICGLAQFDPFGHFGLLVDAFARQVLGKVQVGCGTAFRMKELAG
jgi:hypothetical protein